MRKIVLIFIFFNILANEDSIIINISIPKSGTHLLGKCINLMTLKELFYQSYNLPTDLQELKKKYFFVTHFKYNSINEKSLNSINNTKIFFIYRDPRDELISFIFWGKSFKNNNDELNKFNLKTIFDLEEKVIKGLVIYETYKDLTFDELILQLIFGGSAYYDGVCPDPSNNKTKGISNFYRSYLPWLKFSNICSIKFEDLIGSRGGGSEVVQKKTLRKIANHISKDLTDDNLKEISDKLFGESSTFKEGQIGSWKKYFKPVHKMAFKLVAGDLLIGLGYEKDLDW